MSLGHAFKAKRITVTMILAASALWPAAASTQNIWTSHGPYGGTITALAIDSQTPTTLYAGTLVGGVYKSVDGGESWQAINTGLADVSTRKGSLTAPTAPYVPTDQVLAHLHVTALAIDPLTPTTVYAGTRSGDVFKSTNGGTSWSALDIGLSIRFIRSLIIDPKAPATIYVSGGPVEWLPGMPGRLRAFTGGGVLKSNDGGKNWYPINTGLPTSMIGAWGESIPLVASLAINPQAPSVLYAANRAGLFKTTNGGRKWHAVLGQPAVENLELTTVVVDPQTPATMYAGAVGSSPGSSGSVFKSIDGGDRWSAWGTAGLTFSNVRILAIDPRTPTTLFAAADAIWSPSPFPPTGGGFTLGGLFKSTDGGRNWRLMNTGLAGFVHALVGDPQRPDTVYAGMAAGGVYKTTDRGENWRAVNVGLTGLDLSPGALAIDPKTPATVYVATPRGGVFKSADSGDSWQPVNTRSINPTPVWVLAIDPITPTTIYAGSGGSGVFKSSDGGGSWRSMNAGLSDVATSDITALVIDPQTPTTLYLGWVGGPYGVPSGVCKSSDAGNSWIAINTGLPDSRVVQALAIALSAPATLYLNLRYAGAPDIGVYKTTDGGKTWNLIAQNSDVGSVLGVDPRTPDIVYASGVPSREGSGILKSVDGGITWRPINAGLINLHVHALAIDPQTPTTLYLGTQEWPGQTHGGIFKSIDGGSTWRAINAGLTDFNVIALAIDPRTPSTIYATTPDGVFVLRQ